MGCKVGGLVGYRVRFEEAVTEHTRLKFMTDGMLLREAILDRYLSRYSIIVLDEAHERTVSSDVLLALVKDLTQKRKSLRIVVMSATLEVDKFRKYFSGREGCRDDASNIIRVEGRTFPISIYHTMSPLDDYLDATIHSVL